ncbi:MAG: hypothetical protein M3P41_03415 [Actinomycetota bacterium]|nr:hypothetical protein [Actinomycetota bacterium]
MNEITEKISALIDTSTGDLNTIENALTDGYALVLFLEGERWRLEKRLSEIARSLQPGDGAEQATELSALAKRLDGNAGDLSNLRALLSDLRRHANGVRV